MLDRTKLICDTLASQGHEVVLFDPFRGETKADHPDDTALAWLKSVPYEPNVAKDVEACVAFLLSKGVDQTRIGALGFCWGAWAISKATCSGFDFKCSVWAHPSTGIERRVFNRDEDAMIRGVRMPVLVMCAGNDDERLKNGGELAQLIQLRGGRSHDFPDMIHGFATRCDRSYAPCGSKARDTSIPENRRDAEKALTLASTFFAEHLPS